MLIGIMAIFEMGLSLTGQQMFAKPPQDPYFISMSHRSDDRRFLQLLSKLPKPALVGDPLCNAVKALQSESGFADLSAYTKGLQTPSTHASLIGGCAMNKAGHRILLVWRNSPDAGSGYSLYSCDPLYSNFCEFENSL